MSMTTIKNTDKIKLLDQMLEDIAGDEYDEYGTDENGFNVSNKQSMQYSDIEVLEMIDTAH
jgi:hypothetical protein